MLIRWIFSLIANDAHTHTYTLTYTHTHTHTRTHTHTHTNTYTQTHIHTQTHAHTHTDTLTHTHTHLHKHTRIHTQTHTHTLTYAHIHIHTHVQTWCQHTQCALKINLELFLLEDSDSDYPPPTPFHRPVGENGPIHRKFVVWNVYGISERYSWFVLWKCRLNVGVYFFLRWVREFVDILWQFVTLSCVLRPDLRFFPVEMPNLIHIGHCTMTQRSACSCCYSCPHCSYCCMAGRKSARIKQSLIRSLCLKHSLFCFSVAYQALHCLFTSVLLSNCKSYIVLSQVTDHCAYSRMFHIRSIVRHSRIIYWIKKMFLLSTVRLPTLTHIGRSSGCI